MEGLCGGLLIGSVSAVWRVMHGVAWSCMECLCGGLFMESVGAVWRVLHGVALRALCGGLLIGLWRVVHGVAWRAYVEDCSWNLWVLCGESCMELHGVPCVEGICGCCVEGLRC